MATSLFQKGIRKHPWCGDSLVISDNRIFLHHPGTVWFFKKATPRRVIRYFGCSALAIASYLFGVTLLSWWMPIHHPVEPDETNQSPVKLESDCNIFLWLYILKPQRPWSTRCSSTDAFVSPAAKWINQSYQLILQRKMWIKIALQCRHNVRDGISNQRRLKYLLNCLFRRESMETSKLSSLAFVRESQVDSPHKGPVTGKML